MEEGLATDTDVILRLNMLQKFQMVPLKRNVSKKEVGSKDFYIKYIKKCVNSPDYGGERLIHREGEEGWPGEAGQRNRESGRRQARHEGILSHGAHHGSELGNQPGVAKLPKQENEPTFLQPQAQGRVDTGTGQMDIGPGQVDSVTRQYKEV